MIRNFEDIMNLAREKGPKTISVAAAADIEVLKAVKNANDKGVADAVLVGEQAKIEEYAKEIGMNLENFRIIDEADMAEASRIAVEEVVEGRAHMVMKGLVDTSIILKAILARKDVLGTGRVFSHVAVFALDTYEKVLFVTDAAMNIAPNLDQKRQILENAVEVAHALDIEEPKAAVICAKEKVNPKMPDTVDAAELQKMNEAGDIKGCMVAGPFALDNAVSKEAAKHKGIDHPVAGDADILLMPDIEAGNVLYKSLAFLANGENAGVIVGAKTPIILTSRADSDIAKLNSIALGVLMAAKN